MEGILLVGAGGHARTVADTIERQGKYQIVGLIDNDRRLGEEVYHSYNIIGNDGSLKYMFSNGIKYAVICVGQMGNSKVRRRLYRHLKEIGFYLPVIIDDTAVVANDVSIGEGTYIGRNAVVNVSAKLGKMCIVNTSAVIEHECIVRNFVHIAVHACVCGQSVIGNDVFLGANATVIQQINLGDGSIIGAGSVVIHDVPKGYTVMGNPACSRNMEYM